MSNYYPDEYWAEPNAAELDQLDLVNMEQYNVQDAKTRLSELLNMVERGERVVIAKAGRPVARLVRIERPVKRQLGFLHPLPIPPEFYDPWTAEDMGLPE